jgi:hypothetical protein
MRPRSSTRGTSFIGLVVAASLSAASLTCSIVKRHPSDSNSGATTRAKGFVRVEDLPKAGYLKTDDLAPAPLVPVRPVRGQELTPQLIRKAEDVLKNQEGPLGSQVVVDLGDKTYIARFEWHYHDETSLEKPLGWHKGVTLYTTE